MLQLLLRLVGFAGAGVASAALISMEPTKQEEKIVLPADPWLLTNVPDYTKRERPDPLEQFKKSVWRIFKLVTGISLLQYIIRQITKVLVQIKHAVMPKIINILSYFATQPEISSKPVDPYMVIEELTKVISNYATTTGAYSGELEALNREIIVRLLHTPEVAELLPGHHQKFQHWAIPHMSAYTYEELLLSPQYTSFLVKSKRDGAIYRLEGHFALTPDLTPVPITLYYSKVAYSLNELSQGKITPSWSNHLNSTWHQLGEGADHSRDFSAECRALLMPSDLSRLVSDDDWSRYLGTSYDYATFTREKSKHAGLDVWSITGGQEEAESESDKDPQAIYRYGNNINLVGKPAKAAVSNGKSVRVEIISEPNSPISPMFVTFPETSDSLEDRTHILSPVIMCARWCTYVEHHPELARIVGRDVRLVSIPKVQPSAAPKSDFGGSLLNATFDVAGSRGAITMHVKVAHESATDGRTPLAPVISVWAETDKGNIYVYKNRRRRYSVLHERPLRAPIASMPEESPFLISDMKLVATAGELADGRRGSKPVETAGEFPDGRRGRRKTM